MFDGYWRGAVERAVDPVGGVLHRAGLSANSLTVLGIAGSTAAAIEVLRAAGIDVAQVVTMVDRSGGAAADAMRSLGLELIALVRPEDLGVAT